MACFSAAATFLSTPAHLVISVGVLFAAVSAAFANLCTQFPDAVLVLGSSELEVTASVTNLGAVQQCGDVCRFAVAASAFKAVPDGFKTYVVAV